MNEVSKVMLQIDLHCANHNAYRDHVHVHVHVAPSTMYMYMFLNER